MKTKNYNMELPEEGRNISEEFPILRDNLKKVDQIVADVNTKADGKADEDHTHDLNDVSGLVASLAAKMPLDKTFALVDLSDVLGGKEAKVGYILQKTAAGFSFASAAALLGKHQHNVIDIADFNPNDYFKLRGRITTQSANDLIEDGTYYGQVTTDMTTDRNFPFNGAGIFNVDYILKPPHASYPRIIQRATSTAGDVYIRYVNKQADGTTYFSPWIKQVNEKGGTFTGDIRVNTGNRYSYYYVDIPDGSQAGGGIYLIPAPGTGGFNTFVGYKGGGGVRFYAAGHGDYAWITPFMTNIKGPLKVNDQRVEPPGIIAAFAGKNSPAGWLKCNGAAISRTTYAELFAAIGTTYGAGDGKTTFNLPDLRGEFIRGFDDARGIDKKRILGSPQGDAMRDFTGWFTTMGGYDGALYQHGGGGYWSGTGNGNYGNLIKFVPSAVTPTADENRPRNVSLLYCIKY